MLKQKSSPNDLGRTPLYLESMMTENKKNTNRTASAVLSRHRDREPNGQLSLPLWEDTCLASEDGLKTQDIKERFNISDSEYKTALKQGFIELDPHVILHKGHNHWRVISLMKA